MLYLLIGESGSGKSTVQNELIQDYGFRKVITYTSRPMRHGEVNDVDYHFVDDFQFDEMCDGDAFVEHAVYNNWQYGTAKSDIKFALESDDRYISVVTPSGMRAIKRYAEDVEDAGMLDMLKTFYLHVDRRSRLCKLIMTRDEIDECLRRNISDCGMFEGVRDEVDVILENPEYMHTPAEIASRMHYGN